MAEKEFSTSELEQAALLSQDRQARQGKLDSSVLLTRTLPDYENHLFAALIDLNICLLPVYVWAVEFILILTGVISPLYFNLLFYVMYAALFVVSCMILPLYTASHHGQTIGLRMTGLRIVARNRRPAKPVQLILRQLFGFGIPLMLFGYFFSVFGILIWWAVNGLVVLISPHQQTIADWLFSTVLICVDEIIRAESAAEPAIQPQAPAPVKKEEKKEEEGPEVISPIDLHIRSNYSDDGQVDVEEIMKMAREKGIKVLSITDHNCARANDQAVRFAQMYGIKYIPGVEVDCLYNNQRVRILGYYIDWTRPVFDQIEKASLKREKDNSLTRVRAFEKVMNIRIDVDSILSHSRFQTITADDLTTMVFKNQKTRALPQVKECLEEADGNEEKAKEIFIKKYFGKGSPCEVRGVYPSAISVIEAIHEAGGMAILSSWHISQLKDDTLEGLLDSGLDGIEAFAPDLSVDTMAFLLSLSQQEKLFVTAGSDFHGPKRPERKLGVTNMPPKGLSAVEVFTRALDQPDPTL